MNVINGGSHAGNALAYQEFMIVPSGVTSFEEAMQAGTEVYHHLKAVIKGKYGIDGAFSLNLKRCQEHSSDLSAVNVGDEGGFAPNVQSAEESLDLLKTAISKAGWEGKVKIALDVASSEFYKDGQYDLDFKNPNSDKSKWISGKELAQQYIDMIKEHPISAYKRPH
jgi:enolase